ncbi:MULTISPECIES: GIY-YIG nuclease family protein [Enterococcus]|uniref:GIY-YIG nuclease family protein n=1 Tax=Enterococcus alishanensis TaxID=1303817 RepID=A0ABS6TF39_9ENTE|nr:GIY-YIG nuclease family protein [Enterococcus alishanensis]MBV7391562.1 GIY-YIG nuclease family protein [Enterococcus alishanensis]
MATNAYFYVLLCRDQTYYGGYTTDLSRRLKEHNSGKGAKYTHPLSRRPVQMVHAEVFDSKSAAMKAEFAFKKLNRQKKDIYLQSNQQKNVL